MVKMEDTSCPAVGLNVIAGDAGDAANKWQFVFPYQTLTIIGRVMQPITPDQSELPHRATEQGLVGTGETIVVSTPGRARESPH